MDKTVEDEKHFEEWIKVKEKIHYGKSDVKISEGEVWWCAVGENVGIESCACANVRHECC